MSTALNAIQQSSVSLQNYNTFGINQFCRSLISIKELDSLRRAVSKLVNDERNFMVLGGGSNLLLTSDIDLDVLKIDLKGIAVSEDEEYFFLSVAAGENWHNLVAWSLENGMPGLENLALIPGTVGAAPIQNIGAYGTELKHVCNWVQYLTIPDCDLKTLTADECEFCYRESIFKAALKGRAIITRVGFKLPKKWQPILSYSPLNEFNTDSVTPIQIFNKVVEVRNSKLPDPTVMGNAGSFFKNPIIAAVKFAQLVVKYPELVAYAQDDGRVKLAAGWLIDRAGLKGYRLGAAGIHEKQALVLVNHGGATGAEICELARLVISTVEQKFGVKLEVEPNIIGSEII